MDMNDGGMDMGSGMNNTGDGGLGMGGGMGMGKSACKLAMLWNWNTIDTCFLAGSWHIRTEAMMAGTCIGVFLLVIMLEFVRRAGKEYDALILRQFKDRIKNQAANSEADTNGDTAVFRASPVQQFVRSVIHAAAFAIAYILMLIAMSYNGYVIIMIILGAGFGKFLADWAPKKVLVGDNTVAQAKDLDKCTEDATMCCG